MLHEYDYLVLGKKDKREKRAAKKCKERLVAAFPPKALAEDSPFKELDDEEQHDVDCLLLLLQYYYYYYIFLIHFSSFRLLYFSHFTLYFNFTCFIFTFHFLKIVERNCFQINYVSANFRHHEMLV